MHGVVGAVVAGAGILAEDIDPTVQPTRASFWAFLFLALATVLLVLSFLRHLRRAQTNLGPAEQAPEGSAADPAEGDSR
jgi:sensor histidine kinase regulating citrate/malate metabolism